MKKGKFLCAVMIMAITFTACGLSENKGLETQTGNEGHAGALSSENEKENGVLEEYENPEDGTAPTVYEYEADIIRYGEPVLGKFTFRKDVKKTETAHAVYYFEAAISEQERQACIAAAESAFGCMDGVLPKIEIVVLTPESYDGVSVVGHRLYTSLWSEDFTDFFAACLLAAYGEWGNYGMAYGYADRLCRKAGIGNGEARIGAGEAGTGGGEAETDDGEAAPADGDGSGFQWMSSPELYDLNLLCFDERFAMPEDVEAAKKNACCFVDAYLLTHTEQEFLNLLSDSGTAEGIGRAKESLEAFYAENGVKCCLTEIRYQYGGVTFDYAAACEYASFYIEKDWQERYWEIEPEALENFLHENYGEVKAFFECHAHQMGQYQDFFGFDSYNNDLLVILTNDLSMPSTLHGVYYPESHRIYLNAVMSLMHEYIHSVMFGHFNWESLWRREGSARFLELKYNDYYCYFYDGLSEYYADDHHAQEVFDAFRSFFGRPADIKTDSQVMADLSAYIYGAADPDDSYDSADSFVGYLADRYGEQAAIGYICSDDEYQAEWGKSYEELVQDWQDYICETYSWYGTE